MYTLESFTIIVKYFLKIVWVQLCLYVSFKKEGLYMCLWKSNMFKCAFESIRVIILFVAKPGYFVLSFIVCSGDAIACIIGLQNIKLDRLFIVYSL